MTPTWVFLVFITMVGACVGSFLNVVIYRLPAGESIVHPPSRCPQCGHKLKSYENVPVLGWLWLRGKCSQCKSPISIQYPLIEALTALIFAGAFVLFYYLPGWRTPMGEQGFTFIDTYPLFLVWVTMLACLLAATLIDARHYIIPLGIPRFLSLVAFIVLPVGAAFGKPAGYAMGVDIAFEPFVPMVGETGAMVAWGGAVGLVIAYVLLRLGILPDSFEGEDDDDFIIDDAGDLPDAPKATVMQRIMSVLSPLGFVTGLALSGLLGWGEGLLPGDLHVLLFGFVGYLALRLVVFVWQCAQPKSDRPAPSEEPPEDEVPPLKHPRLVALKELMFVGFPLLGMLIGHFLASRDLFAQPVMATAQWYYVLGGCVLGFLVGGGVIWAIRIFGTLAFNKEAMGMGDIHLLAAIGAVMGWWETVFICFFVAPFTGILWVLMAADAASLTRRPTSQIPYGPFLAIAAALTVVLGVGRVDLADVIQTFSQSIGPAFPDGDALVP